MLSNRANPKTKAYARANRKNPTRAEAAFWQLVKSRRCGGLRFRRQAVILGWIADFYCPGIRLVVELDGASHDERRDRDAVRDYVMRGHGIAVIRIENRDVFGLNSRTLLRRIQSGSNPLPPTE